MQDSKPYQPLGESNGLRKKKKCFFANRKQNETDYKKQKRTGSAVN